MDLEDIVQVLPDIWGYGRITYDWPFLEPRVDLKVKSSGHYFLFLHENIPSAIFFPFFCFQYIFIWSFEFYSKNYWLLIVPIDL